MTVSLWRRTDSLGTIECDLAIVGAGIAGVGAAHWAERRGLNAVVIERYSLAAGASSRNAGFLMRGCAENYAVAAETFGREQARDLWRWTEDNLILLRGAGIEALPTYQRVPSCLLAFEAEECAQLRRASEMLREDGFDVRWAERGGDAVWRSGLALGGLINPNDGACNPYHVMRHLADGLRRPIVQHQEVYEFTADAGGVTLRISDGTVRASRVLFCTNAYAPLLLPAVAPLIEPNRGQMLALDAGDLTLEHSYYANHGYEYFRQPKPGVIVVGGWRKRFAQQEQTGEDRTTDEVQAGLEGFAERLFGRRCAVTARWSGTMGFSKDDLPIIGPVEPTGRAWFCGGFTGHGMSMAFKAAHEAVDAMFTDREPAFSIGRFSPSAASRRASVHA